MSADHLISLVKYNQWANERICGYINEAGEKIADTELISSFPTIRKTLFHLWDAQVIWMKRLRGESSNTWPSHNFNGSLKEAIDLILLNSNDYIQFAEGLIENQHLSDVEFKSLDGTAYHNTIEEIIMHVMNHSTFHRGQLITMLRSAGFTSVGSTDLIRYFRSK
jgi:uncharacterized damage-inducible protein DinB